MVLPELATTFLTILLNVLQVAIVIRVLLSWFRLDLRNPFVRVLYEITEPVLAPFRKVIPPVGGLDFHPLAALFVIGFVASRLGI